jgi:hypothetical protein
MMPLCFSDGLFINPVSGPNQPLDKVPETTRISQSFAFFVHQGNGAKGRELGLWVSLAQDDLVICGEISVGIRGAVRPADFHLPGAGCVAKTEVKTQIILGQIAATAADFVGHAVFSY